MDAAHGLGDRASGVGYVAGPRGPFGGGCGGGAARGRPVADGVWALRALRPHLRKAQERRFFVRSDLSACFGQGLPLSCRRWKWQEGPARPACGRRGSRLVTGQRRAGHARGQGQLVSPHRPRGRVRMSGGWQRTCSAASAAPSRPSPLLTQPGSRQTSWWRGVRQLRRDQPSVVCPRCGVAVSREKEGGKS